MYLVWTGWKYERDSQLLYQPFLVNAKLFLVNFFSSFGAVINEIVQPHTTDILRFSDKISNCQISKERR